MQYLKQYYLLLIVCNLILWTFQYIFVHRHVFLTQYSQFVFQKRKSFDRTKIVHFCHSLPMFYKINQRSITCTMLNLDSLIHKLNFIFGNQIHILCRTNSSITRKLVLQIVEFPFRKKRGEGVFGKLKFDFVLNNYNILIP